MPPAATHNTIVRHKKNAADAYITTKYHFNNRLGRNVVTKTEGVCGCGAGGSEVAEEQFDANLNVKRRIDAEGRITDYSYDAANNLISKTDPLGTQRWTYNTRGQVLTYRDRVDSLIDDAGTLAAPYSFSGNLSTGGPAGYTSYLSADVSNPRSVTYFNASGHTTVDLYYIWHSLVGDSGFGVHRSADNLTWSAIPLTAVSSVDIGGGWTRKRVRATGLTGANYIRVTFQNSNATYPWSLGLDRVELNANTVTNTAVNTYDANGNLLTTTDALGNTTTLTYTTQGQLATVTDPRSKTASFTYDTHGRLTGVTDANNKSTGFGYDARGRLTSTTNALSETTSYAYDLHNRVKKVTHPDTNYVEYTYDLAGRRTAVKDERGYTTTYAYDNAYRLTSITDPLNHTTSFSYDLMHNLTARTDALGNVTNFEYDDFDRLKKVIYPPASTGATRLEETVTYDKVGNVKARVDTAGRTAAYDYDTSNRLVKITDALNKATNFEYNLRSQLTKVKDALNQEYVFTYDPLGRTLSQTRAGTTMRWEYDAAGNRTKRTDHTGRVTDYQYDNLNRLTNVLYSGNVDSTYTYDDLSRLLTAANGAGTVTFTYDNRGRVASETDVHGRVVEFSYDAAGNRTQLKLDSAVHTGYAYDAANRLTALTDDGSQLHTYGYDIADKLISKALPNGVTTTYEYDGLSRLTRLKDATTGSTLYDRQYSYNSANQISGITEPSRTHTFGYDNVDRLTSATDSLLGNESYTYDAVGNRTASHLSASYTTGAFNRVTAATGITQTFDANGNTAARTTGGVAWTYTWDFENRRTQAGSTGATVAYTYDALGRRVKRTEGSTVTKFTHDGEDVVMDDTAGTLTKYQNGPGVDNKISVKQASTTSYFLADHLGSTDALADATGAVTAAQTYDSFGNGTNASFPSRYRFTGREWDTTVGLQFSRARMYDPKLGRFISEDPIGFAGGDINLYGYVHNRPMMFRDPFGKNAASVAADPNVWRFGLPVAAAAAAACPPLGVAVVGGAAIYGAWNFGGWLAAQPWNPVTQPSFPTGPIPRATPIPVPRPAPLPYVPLGPNNPPRDPEKEERCFKQCEHLISASLDGSAFRKCYRYCMGTLW